MSRVQEKKKRIIDYSFIASFLISLLAITGYQYHRMVNSLKTYSLFYLCIIPLSILIGLIILFTWKLIDIIKLRKQNEEKSRFSLSDRIIKEPWNYIISFIFIIVSWTPCYLASFPGFFCYDATQEFRYVTLHQISEHHPVLHQLVLTNILLIFEKITGSYNTGIAVFCISQMIIGAFVFAKMTVMLYKNTKIKWLFVLSLLFYGLTPPVMLFAGCTTKDVLSGLLVILYLQWYTQTFIFCGKEKEHKNMIISIAIGLVLGVLVLLSKKNIPMAFFAFLLFQIPFKNLRKQKIYYSAAQLALFIVAQAAISIAFHPIPSAISESLSVPSQQLTRVYYIYGEEAFTDEQWKKMEKYFIVDELLENYVPQLADPIKGRLKNDEIKDDALGALWLWLSVGIKYPKTYMDSFLILTY